MNDTDATKAPPAWTKRPPMAAVDVATALEACAYQRRDVASREIDRDVADGLTASAAFMEQGVALLRGTGSGALRAATLDKLADYGAARMACAWATTEPSLRSRYTDEAHMFREAARYLKGGE